MNQHIRFNQSVAPFTSFRLGGNAKTIAAVFDVDGLKRAMQINEKYVVLGKGSKVLFSDSGFNGTVILMRSSAFYAVKQGIYAEAGVSLVALSRHYAAQSLLGLEFAVSIPASVGGAIKTNAGAYGSEISELVVYVDLLRNGCPTRLNAPECGFCYRGSGFNSDDVILGACFKAQRGEIQQIKQRRADYVSRRAAAQPRGLGCGSIFKNPANHSAGQLIEQCGLKGASCNNAYVSEKHANFILNGGGASARDVYTLIRAIKAQVYTKTGQRLNEELIYVGSF